jgi:predicted 3-demethylubiquinone-9 3-methyltransferase (glyoxalase superfamily)
MAAAPQKITTFLMFTREQAGRAEEAMTFYTGLFDDGRIESIQRFGPGEHGPEGQVMHATFSLNGQQFMAIDSEPHAFGFTPALSLFVTCGSEAEIDRLYAALSEGGSVMMPLGAYPFAAKFAWVGDRFGVSWQLSLPA